MKRPMVYIYTCIFILSVFGCTSRSLHISDSAFKANVKKIVVLPVHMSDALIPPLPEQLKEMDYDTSERTLFHKKLKEAAPRFQNAAEIVLQKGKFALETVLITEKESAEVFKGVHFKIVPLRIDNNRTWPANFVYGLQTQTITALLEKHKADAVLFHYFQANKRLETYSWSGYRVTYYVTLPHWYLEYSSIIYDKFGKVIFDKTMKCFQMEMKVSLDNGMHRSEKMPVMNMEWYLLDEENVKKEMYKKRGSFYRDFVKI